MPFKSEAQRRYLWANEPEIARDWTDEYGSRIQRDNGGIMRVPFQGGGNYLQNTAAQNMFGKMYHTLNPFEKFQISQAIETYGANEPGITASTGGGGGGGGGIKPQNWSEYTDDPEYDEEEETYYPAEEEISPFKQWSRNFWANPGRRLMQGANMLWNPLGKGAQWAMGAALQGGQGLGQGLSSLRRGLPSQNAYEQARQNRILQGRKEYMMGRREKGLDYGNLANVFQQLGEEDTWVPPQIRKPTAPTTYYPPSAEQHGGGGQRNGRGGGYGKGRDPGGGAAGSPFYRGGRVNFSEGGLASLWI
jgi:hypothetical protein